MNVKSDQCEIPAVRNAKCKMANCKITKLLYKVDPYFIKWPPSPKLPVATPHSKLQPPYNIIQLANILNIRATTLVRPVFTVSSSEYTRTTYCKHNQAEVNMSYSVVILFSILRTE